MTGDHGNSKIRHDDHQWLIRALTGTLLTVINLAGSAVLAFAGSLAGSYAASYRATRRAERDETERQRGR